VADTPVTTETVLVNFTTDTTEIESATDMLLRSGKIDAQLAAQFKRTNTELSNRQKAVNNTAKAIQDATKKEIVSIEQVHAYMESFIADFVAGFQEGIVEELKNAGIEFDEFGKIVNNNTDKADKKTGSLRGQLKKMREEMAQLKLDGKDTTEEYDRLAAQVGRVEDALGDAARESKQFASDTAKIDALIDVATGVAGGFAVAQGAAALFGDESEELQETLLKVNAAMAVLQGLQQIGNLLQKESAAVVTLNTLAQKAYNLVVGESIGLLKAFRIALALTGIGVFIVGITFLVEWLGKSSAAIKQNIKDLQQLSDEIERDVNNLNRFTSEIQRASEERVAALTAQGATQKEIRAEQLNGLKEEQNGVFELEQSYRSQAMAARELLEDVANRRREFNSEEVEAAEEVVKKYEELTERRKQLSTELRVQSIQNVQETRKEELQAIADSAEARLAGARKNTAQELALAKQAARARAAVELNEAGQNLQQRLLIEANLQKQLRELDLNFSKVRQEDRIAGLEASLLAEQRASRAINARITQDEIDIQKRIIQERARLELLQEGLTANQRLQIQQQALNDQAELQRNFNQQTRQEALEDFISTNNAQLQQVDITNAEKLRLSEENIIAQAEIEIEAAQGLSDKIKEITAKRDADIRALRLANIQETLNRELELETARTGVLRRAQERIVANERIGLQARIAGINQLAALDIAAINARQDANDRSFELELISYEKWLLEYEKLTDEENAITEAAELKKRELYRQTQEEQIGIAINVAGQILDIIQQAGQQQLEAQQQQLDAQRNEIDELLEAGAITEREAERRQKRLDIEEKRLRRQQAQREKDFATFKALLAIPQAFLQGLVQGGPILGAIYAGIAAAQAILIASRQVPKFGKGKNNDYEGPAELGETGPELWVNETGMHYVPKRTIVWVNKNDKVFNPAQTRAMLDKPPLRIERITEGNTAVTQNISIDYDKLGAAVGRNIPQTGLNIDKDGITQWVQGANSLTKYLDIRRSY
jgi:hypothetical protein